MNVIITFTSIGTDAGPFDLYSDVDGYANAFEKNVSRTVLLTGFHSAKVPDGTTTIAARSTGICKNLTYVLLPGVTTTTQAPTTTTTTTEVLAFGYGMDVYRCGVCANLGGDFFYNATALTIGKFYFAPGTSFILHILSLDSMDPVTPDRFLLDASGQTTCAAVICPPTTTTTTT